MLLLIFFSVSIEAQSAFSTPGSDPPGSAPYRDLATRVVVPVQTKRAVSFDAAITSILVLDPEILSADVSNSTTIIFTGIKQGETPVIISGATSRRTIMVEVQAGAAPTPEQFAAAAGRRERAMQAPAGTYAISFSPSFAGGPSLVRQTFDYTRKLSPDRTLRIAGDTSKIFGGNDNPTNFSAVTRFGLNRLSLGLDTPAGSLDLLDSELNISPLTLAGYTMRGLHVTSTANSPLHGIEFFAGLARPSLTLLDNSAGLVGGFMLPVAHGKSWRVRAGVLLTVARLNITGREGGLVWRADGRYAPDDRTTIEGEGDFANGAFSGRAMINLRRGAFNIYGESLRLDRRSPMIGIGAQSGGRKLDSFNIGWKPSARLNVLVGYSRSASIFLVGSQQASLSNSNLNASANYNLTRNSTLGLRLSEQHIETNASGLSAPLKLATTSASITHSMRFGGHWNNSFEANLISSRESTAGAKLEQGESVREELSRTWEHWSGAAFFDYNRNSPSLANLIVQNPGVLPIPLRRLYEADPARFLVLNRDILPSLLGGIELPTTRNRDLGARFQGAISRYTLSGEARYSAGEIFARQERSLSTSLSVSMRIDDANVVQVSGSRSFSGFAAANQALITISYIHRFGGAANAGFQFSKLLGLDHGRIEGRVFFDHDGDGRDDESKAGVAGVKIQLDGDRSITTDEHGRYHFSSLDPGEYNVALISSDLGVRLRASTITAQRVSLTARHTSNVSFGLTDTGFVSGRAFNDLSLTGREGVINAPGVNGVRFVLHSDSPTIAPLTQTVDASGMYEFRNLAPGRYTLEIDPGTLPANFRIPAELSWAVTVKALNGTYLDVALSAQRTLTGRVFIDTTGDGQFDPKKDGLLKGVRIVAGRSEAVTDQNGAYILRNLPAGKVVLRTYSPSGKTLGSLTVQLDNEPVMRTGINLPVPRKSVDQTPLNSSVSRDTGH